MSNAFQYRPKFVDIRVRKPGSAKTAKIDLPPEERPCDHIGCKSPGAHKAPKSRERANEYWFFCTEHAADYNRRWNYFAGMTDSDLQDFQRAAETGHRPTWSFRASKTDRLSAAMRGHAAGKRPADPFGLMGEGETVTPRPAPKRRLSRLQILALEVMDLDDTVDAAAIRARYAELVKKWHPDSNGGDRSAETMLQKVVQAYQTLKTSGLV